MTVTPRRYASSPSEALVMKEARKGSELIHAGMAALDRLGWCQGGIANSSGEVCGHGGIEAAAADKRAELPATIMQCREQSLLGMGFFLGPANNDVQPPTVSFVANPEREAYELARHAAHKALTVTAEKHGWTWQEEKHEVGCVYRRNNAVRHWWEAECSQLPGCVPMKDPFAVFNDDPGTTIEDVALMMKEAAAWLESQGM